MGGSVGGSVGEGAASYDGWIDQHDVGVPPIQLGSVPSDGGRWLLFGDPDPVGGFSVSRISTDLDHQRGYRDRHSRGGGLSLFLSSVPLALALRHVQQQPVPRLDPADTWARISAYGNPRQVIVTRRPSLEHRSMDQFVSDLHALMDPSFAAIRALTGFSIVAQWAQFTSALADLLLSTPIVAEGEALAYLDGIAAADPYLRRSRPRIGSAPWQGRARPFATRRVCCFNFRGTSGSYCGSLCPLVPEPERRASAQEGWASADQPHG